MPEKQQKVALIVAGVMLGVFLSGIDALVVGTAMPTIVDDLGGLHFYSWVFSSYMLMTAVFMPVFGKLSDLWGRKRIFNISIAFFLLGSILSGTAHNMLELVLYRVVQGIGSGGMAAVPFAIIGSVFPPKSRGRAFGFIAAVWGISSIIGPALGSFIVTHLTWRWVFYVNIPFGLASIALINIAYHELHEREPVSVDIKGALALGSSIVALLLVFFTIGNGEAIISVSVLSITCIFLVMSYFFVLAERKANDPILPLEFFQVRAFKISNVCGFLGGFAIFGGIAFVPLFIQSVQGGSPMKIAMVITPMSLGWSGASIAGGQILHWVGARILVMAGMGLMAIGFLLASFVQVESPLYYMIIAGMFIGIGMGAQTPALLATAQNSLHSKVLGVATSTQLLSRMLGGAIGASVMGAALTHSMQTAFRTSSSSLMARFPDALKEHLGEPHQLLTESMRETLQPQVFDYILNVFTQALHTVFITGSVVAAVGVIVGVLLPKSSS